MAKKRRPPPDQATPSPAHKSIPEQFAQRALYCIAAIANNLNTGASQAYLETYGLGITEVRVMRMLGLEAGIQASRISDVSGLDKSVISRALTNLEKLGFAMREPDPADSRRSLWSATAEGGDLADNYLSPSAAAREELLFHGMSDIERVAALHLLRRMLQNVPLVMSYQPPKRPARDSAR